ncbi:hypothetical protein E2C01_059940 [Portunus trituberculatus]|uniref:Uncharacterized protein n=1 Tax=Portunus trituberculatus TaxID=210409 RepID=A0A5B7HAN2_PORTR|nr:hypothetical protein [Portunus trituberculatus]
MDNLASNVLRDAHRARMVGNAIPDGAPVCVPQASLEIPVSLPRSPQASAFDPWPWCKGRKGIHSGKWIQDPKFFNNVRATSCSEMASMNA